jgi:hypothetical protein
MRDQSAAAHHLDLIEQSSLSLLHEGFGQVRHMKHTGDRHWEAREAEAPEAARAPELELIRIDHTMESKKPNYKFLTEIQSVP